MRSYKYLGHIMPGKEPPEYLAHVKGEAKEKHWVIRVKRGSYYEYTCFDCMIKWS